MTKTVSIPQVLGSFQETWLPHLIATVNDQHVKVAKIDGEFIWHSHPNSDELFYLLSGKLTLEIAGETSVVMSPGDVFVVPRGVKHKPVAQNAQILMVEQIGTVNTGDEPAYVTFSVSHLSVLFSKAGPGRLTIATSCTLDKSDHWKNANILISRSELTREPKDVSQGTVGTEV